MPDPTDSESTELIAVDRDEDRGLVAIRDTSFLRSIAEIAEILSAPADPDDLDVKPDGSVYLSHCHVRARLDKAFGPPPNGWKFLRKGDWSMRTTTDKYGKETTTVVGEFGLWIREPNGHWDLRAEACGEGDYQSSNANAGYTDATEAAKSQALTRACKDLGIGRECWDRHFTDRWRAAHCIQVRTKRWDGQLDTNKDGSPKLSWKRRDSTLHNEWEPQQPPQRGADRADAPRADYVAPPPVARPQQPLTAIDDPYTLPANAGDLAGKVAQGIVDRVAVAGDRFGVVILDASAKETIYGTGSRLLAEWALAHVAPPPPGRAITVEVFHTVEDRAGKRIFHLHGIRRVETREPGDDTETLEAEETE
jgi:hypothetical protein